MSVSISERRNPTEEIPLLLPSSSDLRVNSRNSNHYTKRGEYHQQKLYCAWEPLLYFKLSKRVQVSISWKQMWDSQLVGKVQETPKATEDEQKCRIERSIAELDSKVNVRDYLQRVLGFLDLGAPSDFFG